MKPRKELESYFRRVTRGDAAESAFEAIGEAPDLSERIEKVDVLDKTDAEVENATSAVRKLARGEEWTGPEAEAFEAIVLPAERPVIDIRNDSFGNVEAPFAYMGSGGARQRIEAAIPSVGRIGVPELPQFPFAGTGFVVGDGLLMTNRHVANLFTEGLGRRGISFKPGQAADIDFEQEIGSGPGSPLEIERIVMVHPYWDMALLRVRGLDAPALEFLVEDPRDLVDRDVAVIGYPAFDRRNDVQLQMRIFRRVFDVKRLQPGRLRGSDRIRSFENVVSAATHDSSTLGGNSGSAVVDVETGRVVALQFAGRYLEANYAVPMRELGRDRRVHDAGIDFGDVRPDGKTLWDSTWRRADPKAEERSIAGADAASPDARAGADVQSPAGATLGAPARWSIPLHVTVHLGEPPAAGDVVPAGVDAAIERMMEPFHEEDYDDRPGYDERFLGKRIRLPRVRELHLVSRLDDGEHVIPYEHFSLVMHKERRIALYTACNVDGREDSREPEPGRGYTRRALSGLGRNDKEKWFTEPRIPELHQLPDRFFTKDRTAFDKGHLVRRDAVAWGDDYDELRRANGDTYHVTNCSPQVKGFNRSNLGGLWGELENLVLDQAEDHEGVCTVFSGPILNDDDPPFGGFDDLGRVVVQIPQRFWKVIVARRGRRLETYAFVLDQDLRGVDFGDVEAFDVDREWRRRMISLPELEEEIGLLEFPKALHESDQIDADAGETIRSRARIERV